MLCDKCKQNEAVFHIKEFKNGKMTTTHLCQQCALENSVGDMIPGLDMESLKELILSHAEMVTGKMVEKDLANSKKSDSEKKHSVPTPDTAVTCPVCHLTLQKYKENGFKLGCPECYTVFFKPLVTSAIEKLQRGGVHLGKHPMPLDEDSPESKAGKLAALKRELELFIAREDYESAAICRDQIAELNKSMSTAKDGSQ